MSVEYEFGFAEPTPIFKPPPAGDDSERLARLRLIRSRRVGPATYLRLMGEHGDASAALASLPDVARAAGVQEYSPCPVAVAVAELRAAKRHGARMLCLGDPDYPAALAEIADAPPLIWVLGKLSVLNRPLVSVVGTRNASALGARMVRKLARELGEAGCVVVSGLARGIDALAHRAALETGTIAVHAGGLDVIYPAENTDLARDIGQKGLRVSEMPFGLEPRARHFPQRNRIVSGLSRAVIVVEAAGRSGSMITARAALDQGREVMAVPGHPLDSRASGTNMLLRDGAILVRGANDVIEALGVVPSEMPDQNAPPVDASPKAAASSLAAKPEQAKGGVEGAILAFLGPAPVAEDQLIRDLGEAPRTVAQALAILEMAGRITRSAGGMVHLV